jgi:pseudaminic acid synthase
MKIGDKEIGEGHPVFIVAELSSNHCNDFDIAVKTIKAAKEAGADAIKLQTYTADTITIDCDDELFQIKHGTLWDGKNLHDLYKESFMPWDWQPKLKKIAEDLGLVFFSAPFDKTAVDFLEKMDVPAYKVASFEITDIPLIEYMASKGKPIMISTGISTLADIEEAVGACRKMGNDQIIVLKCTSVYPTPMEEVNLRTIPDMKERFGVEVGVSDHTLGISVPVASVVLGATFIEKHLALDRKLDSADSAFSLEPSEFKMLVDSVRDVEKALGKVSYDLTEKTKKKREFARSLFVVEDCKAGDTLSEENVRSIRPAHGMHPRNLKEVLGKRFKKDAKKGTPLSQDLLE